MGISIVRSGVAANDFALTTGRTETGECEGPRQLDLILALATIAATGAAAVLGVPGPGGEIESTRMREIEALLETTRQASALCTSAPAKPERQSQ